MLGKVLVTVERSSGFLFGIKLLDTNGEPMAMGANGVALAQDPAGLSPLPDMEVECSDTTRRVLDALKASVPASGSARPWSYVLPADLLKQVYDPVRYEPLATLPTDMLVSLAKALKAPNLVAVVPDDLLTLRSAATKRLTVADVRDQLVSRTGGHGMAPDVRDGRLTVTYRWPSYQRLERVDRRALRDLYASYRSGGVLRLDAAAAFAVGCGEMFNPCASQLFEALPDPGFQWTLMTCSHEPESLRFYGLLGPTQKSALLEGRTLAAANLTAGPIAILRDRVYRDTNGLSVDAGAGAALDQLLETTQGEPTELLPDGIPASTTISLRGKTMEGFLPVGEGNGALWGVMSFAMGLWQREHAGKGSPGPLEPEPKLFRAGREVDVELSVRFIPGLGLNWWLRDQQWAPLSKAVSVSDLPPEFLQEVQTTLAAMRKYMSKP